MEKNVYFFLYLMDIGLNYKYDLVKILFTDIYSNR